MLCPICKTVKLSMMIRNNIEIDYCPDCRGVWLDRGELDKIIEGSLLSANPSPSKKSGDFNSNSNNSNMYENYNSKHQENNHTENQHYYKKKKKENWLGEIFDF